MNIPLLGISLRKLACAFLLMSLITVMFPFFEGVYSANYIMGTLDTSTWTAANSPYTLTGNVIVNSGATLTIQPGVKVNLDTYQIIVNGILNAQGTTNAKIVFSSTSNHNQKIDFTSTSSTWSDQAGSGCIVDNAVIDDVPIVVENASPRISNNYFVSTANSPVIISGGSPSIVNNVVNLQSYAEIHVNYGSPSISCNTIKGQGQNYGIYTEGTALITNNNITGCYSGIYSIGASNIQQNNIINNVHDAIRSNNSASKILNNVVSNNLCGIGGEGNILGNTIANNNYGLWGPTSLSIITNNNIFSNTENIHLTENSTKLENVNATNNWWGTTDAAAINQTIWDSKNATNLGTVDFIPFLNEPNPSTPLIPVNIPIPTAPPTTYNTPTPTPASTPTPYNMPTSTSTPIPIWTATATPAQTPSSSMLSHLSSSDINNIVVIVLAFALASAIIIIINLKFVRIKQHRIPKKQEHQKPNKK